MKRGVVIVEVVLFLLVHLSCRDADRPQEPPATPWERARLPTGPGRWQASLLPTFDAAAVAGVVPPTGLTVIALWATWCEPCIAEMPELSAFAEAHRDVLVLGLVTDPPDAFGEQIQSVLDRVRPKYPQAVLVGGEGALLARFALEWDGILPKTFVVRDGKALGGPLPVPVTRASIEAALAPYLGR